MKIKLFFLILISTQVHVFADTSTDQRKRNFHALLASSVSVLDLGLFRLDSDLNNSDFAKDFVFENIKLKGERHFLQAYNGSKVVDGKLEGRIVIRGGLFHISANTPARITKASAEEACAQILNNLQYIAEGYLLSGMKDYFLEYTPLHEDQTIVNEYMNIDIDDLKELMLLKGRVLYGKDSSRFDCESDYLH